MKKAPHTGRGSTSLISISHYTDSVNVPNISKFWRLWPSKLIEVTIKYSIPRKGLQPIWRFYLVSVSNFRVTMVLSLADPKLKSFVKTENWGALDELTWNVQIRSKRHCQSGRSQVCPRGKHQVLEAFLCYSQRVFRLASEKIKI